MKTKKVFALSLLSMALLLSACGGGSSKSKSKNTATEAINKGDYQIVIPFESSDARQVHIEYNRGEYDITAVGKGLMNYSKEYFDPDTYYVQEGKVLDRDTLSIGTVYGDKEGILGFKNADNNYGLNPEKGSNIPISDTKSIKAGEATIPIVDVFEIDFYESLDSDAEISGMSFAIVLNPKVKDANGKEVTIKDEQLKSIGEEAARNLAAYLETLPDIKNNKNILIALFKASSSDDSLAGTFLEYGYGKGKVDSYKAINEKWAIFPGEKATDLDSVTSTEFSSIQNSLHLFLPNDLGIVGKGKFDDNKLTQLNITITAQAKTYTECVALVQYLKEQLSTISAGDVEIICKVNNNTETFAMLQRKSGSNEVSVIME